MAITPVVIGRKRTGSPDPDYGFVGAGVMRANIFSNPGGGHIWITRLGIRAGKWTSTNGSLRVVAYDAQGGLNTRLGYTAELAVTTLLNNSTGSGGGQDLEAALAVSDNGPSTKGTLLPSGHALGLAYVAVGAAISHNMSAASRPGMGGNNNFYDKASGSTPPNPFGSVSGVNEGQMSIYAIGYYNEAPRVPVNRLHGSPGNMTSGPTIDTTTPTFESDFRSRLGAWGPANDGYDAGNTVKRTRIKVFVGSSPTPIWDFTYANTSGERAANKTSRLYTGPALSQGVEYQWTIAHQDQADAWGEESNRLSFTPASAGIVTATGPTGKQDVLNPTISGRWHHATGRQMATIQARVRQGGSIVQTSAAVAKVVASSAIPGTAFTVSFADLGLSDLNWEAGYSIELRAVDEDTVQTGWSDATSFTTNYAPTIPTGITPGSGIITSLPVLVSFAMSDPDDDPGTGLEGHLVVSESGTPIDTLEATLNVSTGMWEVELDSVVLDAYGDYQLTAYGFDGTLYSGGDDTTPVTSEMVTLTYADGPDVTITSHATNDTIDTVRPLIEYTAPTQVRRNVEIYDVVTGALVRRSGWQITDQKSYRPSAGYLKDEGIYRFVVSVEDGSSLIGTAEVTNITVAIERPDALENVEAEAVTIGNEPQPSAIRVRWGQTEEDLGEWEKYLLYRSDLDLPLAEVTSPSQLEYIDYFPRSGETLTYAVSQVTEVDGTSRESELVEVSASVDFGGVVMCAVNDPTGTRFMGEAWSERGWQSEGQEASYIVNDEAPFTIRTAAFWYSYTVAVDLADYDEVVAAEQERALRSLARTGGVVCYRDANGRRDYVSIPRNGGVRMSDGRNGYRSATIQLRSEAYAEGIESSGDVV